MPNNDNKHERKTKSTSRAKQSSNFGRTQTTKKKVHQKKTNNKSNKKIIKENNIKEKTNYQEKVGNCFRLPLTSVRGIISILVIGTYCIMWGIVSYPVAVNNTSMTAVVNDNSSMIMTMTIIVTLIVKSLFDDKKMV